MPPLDFSLNYPGYTSCLPPLFLTLPRNTLLSPTYSTTLTVSQPSHLHPTGRALMSINSALERREPITIERDPVIPKPPPPLRTRRTSNLQRYYSKRVRELKGHSDQETRLPAESATTVCQCPGSRHNTTRAVM